MRRTNTLAAATGGRDEAEDEPHVEELMADPEIARLLNFAPVERKVKRADGWSADLQQKFVAWTAFTGSRTRAAEKLGREVAGASKLCRATGGAEFAEAVDAAMKLYQERLEALAAANPGRPWSERPSTRSRRTQEAPLPGEVLNEHGEYEDEASYRGRGAQAADSICGKLLRIRRLFLQEIGGSPGKRAAFEILTGHAIDWKKAAKLQPQDDEPYRTANQRHPDMVLLADSGWSFGEYGYGPDRKAELRAQLDQHRLEEGLPPIDWDSENAENEDERSPVRPERSRGASSTEQNTKPRVARL